MSVEKELNFRRTCKILLNEEMISKNSKKKDIKKKGKKRLIWVKQWIGRRSQFGTSDTLLKELMHQKIQILSKNHLGTSSDFLKPYWE